MEVLFLVIGFVIGAVASYFFASRNSMGTICVDQSDPTEAPYLFLELGDPMAVASIMKKKHVTFKVKLHNYISQK